MTINEEKKRLPKSPIYGNTLNAINDECKLLISLLNEYGDKLVKLCDKIQDNKKKFSLIQLFFPGLGGGIALITCTIFYFQQNIYSAIIGIFIFILFTFYTAILTTNIKRKIKTSEREAKKILLRLEKVIHIASQTQDYLSPEIPTMMTRVELDLRLADAESALEYYQEIIGK